MYSDRIKTPRLVIRPSTEEDANRAIQIQSDCETVRLLPMAYHPPEKESMHAWFKQHLSESTKGSNYRFVVELREYVIGVADIDKASCSAAEISYWLDKEYWGKGYVSEVAQALVRYAFETLGFSSVSTCHAMDNFASQRVLKRIGFYPTKQKELEYPVRGEHVMHQSYNMKNYTGGPV